MKTSLALTLGIIILSAGILLATFLTGCSALRTSVDSGNARHAVEAGTHWYLDQYPDRHEEFLEAVDTLRVHVEDTEVTLAMIEGQVLAEFDFEAMSTGRELTVRGILHALGRIAREKISEGALSSQDRVLIHTALDWAETAARQRE